MIKVSFSLRPGRILQQVMIPRGLRAATTTSTGWRENVRLTVQALQAPHAAFQKRFTAKLITGPESPP